MKIVRKEKKKNKKKLRIEQKKIDYKPWKVRSKKYSEYPYIVTVSFFRKNVFMSASDLRGRIKLWTNAGRLGFKGADKTQFLAVVEVAQDFFKRLLRHRIRDVFLKFNNFKRSRPAIRKAIKKLKLAGRSRRKKVLQKKRWKWITTAKGKRIKIVDTTPVKIRGRRQMRFLGIWTELHISFNGCRNKKQRRKRHRRKAKKIRSR